MSTKPAGYINRKIPESIEEALSQYSTDSIKMLTKSGIQRYVESFFTDTGKNRALLQAISTETLKFSTDASLDPNKDAEKRSLQIARIFEGIRQELPAVLIADTSFKIVPNNFTGIEAVFVNDGYKYERISIAREVGISLVVGARDVSTIDLLHGVLSILFSEMRFKAGGNRITGNSNLGETWVLVLPQPELSQVNKSLISDDVKDHIYTFNIDLDSVIFEDSILIKTKIGPQPFLNEGVMNPEGGYLSDTVPQIIVPDTIRMGEKVPVYFRLLQTRIHSFRISDPNICTFEPIDCILNPRRLGTFELQVVKKDTGLVRGEVPNNTASSDTVVTSKMIRVVP